MSPIITAVLNIMIMVIVYCLLKVILFSLQTVYFYYKTVNCSYKSVEDIEQELNTSLPGTDFLFQYVCSFLANLRTFAPKNFPRTDFFRTLTDDRK